ncbi:hypothetical protein [Martelella radicis]|uniref:Glutamyl-tRNA amidotransferase n=1 Tax=Martelella radicis TaxID=1397476 RepID=A0A7W6PA49_9HYPH|nr:hypothetical protein [Martelella radicis]MBB4121239.1 hypothetical protein [Martelella radicis]
MTDHSTDIAESFRARLRDDLKTAMRTRDRMTVGVTRSLIAAVDNAQAVRLENDGGPYVERAFGAGGTETARNELTAEGLRILLEREATDRRKAADELAAHGQDERAETLRKEADVVDQYRQA